MRSEHAAKGSLAFCETTATKRICIVTVIDGSKTGAFPSRVGGSWGR